MREYLSLDVGGTYIKYGLVDDGGIISQISKVKTPTNLRDFIGQIAEIINKYSNISGVGLSTPGRIDQGKIYFGGSVPYLDGIPLKVVLESEWKLPVSIVNDGKAALLAEHLSGSLKNIDNGVVLVLGTAVGGGLLVNGELLLGKRGQAGEVSFMVENMSVRSEQQMIGERCSAVAFVKKAAKKLNLKEADGIGVFSAIKNNDTRVISLFEEFCRNIAVAIVNLQAVLDMEKVAIGGGISSQKILIDEINRQYSLFLSTHQALAKTLGRPDIVQSKYGNKANLLGAVYTFVRRD